MTDRKHKPVDIATKKLVKELTEIEELMAFFDFRLKGYEPGIEGFNSANMVLSFGEHEWNWLKPILKGYRTLKKEYYFDSKIK